MTMDICPQILVTVSDCCTPFAKLQQVSVAIKDHTTGTSMVFGITNSLGLFLRPVYGSASYDITVSGTVYDPNDGLTYECSSTSISNVSVGSLGLVSVTACLHCRNTNPKSCVEFLALGCNAGYLYSPSALIAITGPQNASGDLRNGYIRFCFDATGTYNYTVTLDRFIQDSGTFTISSLCGTGSLQSFTKQLTPASGYYCYTGKSTCLYPLPSVLHCSFANAGPQVFTYASGQWTATFTYLTIGYVINLAPNGTMTATKAGVGFTPTIVVGNCPLSPSFSGTITPHDPGSVLGNGSLTE